MGDSDDDSWATSPDSGTEPFAEALSRARGGLRPTPGGEVCQGGVPGGSMYDFVPFSREGEGKTPFTFAWGWKGDGKARFTSQGRVVRESSCVSCLFRLSSSACSLSYVEVPGFLSGLPDVPGIDQMSQ